MNKSLVTRLWRAMGLIAIGHGMYASVSAQSFDCRKVEAGSIEEMICQDGDLSGLDEKMAEVYDAALKKAANERPPVLKAEQRGWIKGRNDCWKSEEKRQCVEQAYLSRIAEVQARYRLVPFTGPIFYLCDDRSEVVANFFETDPPTLVAERGDQVSLMVLHPSGSGAKYKGRNETFWDRAGEAMVTWGYGSPGLRCKKKP